MTTKADFSAEEWQLILEAPPSAGMIVVTAQRGGVFRENHRYGQGLRGGAPAAR